MLDAYAHKRPKLNIYDDRDLDGIYNKKLGDRIVGKGDLRKIKKTNNYEFRIKTMIYSAQKFGCQGDEQEACLLKCDEVTSPLAIDFGLNGFSLTSKSKGVNFDLRATGQKIKTAWLAPEGDDYLLTLDRNRNSTIDNGSELFGSATVLQDGTFANDGFDALRDLDENGDGYIDSNDSLYKHIGLWNDYNHNGVSEAGEIVALSSYVKSIPTDEVDYQLSDVHGNIIKGLSQILLWDGTGRNLVDIWFAH